MAFATHILVPTDFSDASELAVDAAAMLARELGAKITVVHVHDPDALRAPATIAWSPAEVKNLSDEIERSIDASFAILKEQRLKGIPDVDSVIVHDASASRAICDLAENLGTDLIVISTHGRTGLKHLLIGSVAERVVRHATCPVLTLRSKKTD
jgi:nucleotide-binding universal stress UspA family protein